MKTFEQYLQDIHAVNYNGTDDNMPEAFENWLSNLDTDSIIQYGQNYGVMQFVLGEKGNE